MLIKENLPQYKDEIVELYKTFLSEEFTGGTIFGIIEDGVLQAVSSVRCYSGHWYLRGCVVKPEFRGQGLQRKLTQERINYIADKTDVVNACVYPGNNYSVDNLLAENFVFAGNKKLPNGDIVNHFKLELQKDKI
ncbi:MAG: GNAT family N-acetyltransferase [archaeon]